jgi:phage regulator Rha-like protein
MTNLTVSEVNNQLVVDSRLVADNLGIEHDTLKKSIKEYKTQIEQAFGTVSTSSSDCTNSVGAVNKITFAYLTEDQATFLMTLSRNTSQVIQAKINLVHAFSEAKKLIKEKSQTGELTTLQYAKLYVAAEEEKLRLQAENTELNEEVKILAETVDELFDYSSIIRIAKFNNCSEKDFNWRKLKQASGLKDIEIKKVPCPRYGTKNLYNHSAWMLAYPEIKLPEATSLRKI